MSDHKYGPHSNGSDIEMRPVEPIPFDPDFFPGVIIEQQMTRERLAERYPLVYTQAQVDAHVKAENVRWAEIADAAYERGRTQERERCTKIAETTEPGHPFVADWEEAAVDIAAKIREGK